VAATDPACRGRWREPQPELLPTRSQAPLGSLVLAACALPGVMPARAAEAPEQAVLSVQLAGYRDRQPGLDRIKVTTPSVHGVVPLNERWSVEGALTHDDVSGASPRYYSDVSGASRMSDERVAGNLEVTRHFERRSLSAGLARSTENDYRSTALSLGASQDSEDRNTRWQVGLGLGHDRIDPVNRRVVGAERDLHEVQLGWTQALDRQDLVQLSATFGRSRGYHSDPYKLFDRRPDSRDMRVLLVRWNHGFLGPTSATLRSSWRLYDDSWGVRGHSLELAWVQPLGEGWTVTPSWRGHTQRAAAFYVDPVTDRAIYPGPIGKPQHVSTDQRLSAFGAATLGVKLEWRVDRNWSVDTRFERYEQRSDWRVGGDGSPGLAPLSARIWQLGLTYRF
jgi:hypothetical protein